jgi:CHASE2 domain-containing sensor protein/signal transduction histidine kinase
MVHPLGLRRGITPSSLLVFLCLLLALSWLLTWSDATHKLDRLLHDSWVRLSQSEPANDIVIAAIDPGSLQQLGRWPWPRDLQSLLFERLAEYRIKAAVVDLLYTERSRSAQDDTRLSKAIAGLPNVVLPVLTEGRIGRAAEEKLPLPELTRGVSDLGHIVLPIDDDGIVRRVHLKSGYNTPHWSTLALAAYDVLYADDADVMIGDNAAQPADSSLPGRRTAADYPVNQWVQDHEVMIPFYGPRGTFKTVSAASIVSGKADAESLRGKIVFVGITAIGLSDVVPTPVSALDQPVPGVEIHANIFTGLRDARLVTRLDAGLNVLVALVLLPLMLLLYSRAGPQWGLAGALVGTILPIILSLLLYRWARLWYPPLAASVPVLVSYMLWSWHRLGFVNRFLEHENSKLEPHLAERDSRDNLLLAEFFTNAAKHLPIDGWRFSAQGQQFLGGDPLPVTLDGIAPENWIKRQSVYCKQYPTPGRLEIKLAIADDTIAQEVTAYIDTLARVRSRTKPSRWSGSIERLQSNAMKLSDQMAWLRSVKVFSETMLAGSPAGFIVWNAAGEMVRGNQLVFELLPHLSSEPVLFDFVRAIGRHPASGADHKRIQLLILKGEPWQVTGDLTEQEYIVSFSAVGKTLSERLICASVIDVSEIRSAERARAEVIDYLSHDLRSPLISAVYLLETDDTDEYTPEERTERIEKNIRLSLHMMDDLLYVARADSLSADTFSEMLFNAVVDNALDQLLPQARNRNITIDVDTAEEDLWMDGDPASLERAVVNIIGNAIKYSQEGGLVSVFSQRELDDVVLSITDEGVGIDPAMMGDLFTRFKRDASTADKFKGIGLGLAQVSRVVKQHSGEVSAESSGQGTCITMRLPLKVMDEEQSGMPGSTGNLTIQIDQPAASLPAPRLTESE